MWSLTFSTYCHLMYWNSITLSWTTLTNCSLIHEGFWRRRGMHSWGCILAMIWHGCMSFHWPASCQQYVCMCGVRSDFTLLCDYWMIYGDNVPIDEMTYCAIKVKLKPKKSPGSTAGSTSWRPPPRPWTRGWVCSTAQAWTDRIHSWSESACRSGSANKN